MVRACYGVLVNKFHVNKFQPGNGLATVSLSGLSIFRNWFVIKVLLGRFYDLG